MLRLTGLDTEENQARRLLNDLDSYIVRSNQQHVDEAVVAHEWLTAVFEPVVAPLWVLRLITRIGEVYGRLTGHITALNNDKYHILKQRNWRCNIEPTVDELGYHPQYNLQQGTQETMAWYQQQHWL